MKKKRKNQTGPLPLPPSRSLATNQQQTIMPVSVGWGSKMGRLFLGFFFFFLLSQVLCCLLLDFIVSHSFSPKKKGKGKHYTKLISLQPTTSTTSEILIHSLNLFFFWKAFFSLLTESLSLKNLTLFLSLYILFTFFLFK